MCVVSDCITFSYQLCLSLLATGSSMLSQPCHWRYQPTDFSTKSRVPCFCKQTPVVGTGSLHKGSQVSKSAKESSRWQVLCDSIHIFCSTYIDICIYSIYRCYAVRQLHLVSLSFCVSISADKMRELLAVISLRHTMHSVCCIEKFVFVFQNKANWNVLKYTLVILYCAQEHFTVLFIGCWK